MSISQNVGQVNCFLIFMYQFTESQNCRIKDWLRQEGTSGGHLIWYHCLSRTHRLCLDSFWISSTMEIFIFSEKLVAEPNHPDRNCRLALNMNQCSWAPPPSTALCHGTLPSKSAPWTLGLWTCFFPYSLFSESQTRTSHDHVGGRPRLPPTLAIPMSPCFWAWDPAEHLNSLASSPPGSGSSHGFFPEASLITYALLCCFFSTY